MPVNMSDMAAEIELLKGQVQQLLTALNEAREKVNLEPARIQVPIRGVTRHEG